MKDSGGTEQAELRSGARDGEAALHALCLVARLHQVPADPAALLHQLGKSPSEPVSTEDLFSNPRILIFDEATSALDYESEAIVQRNMAAICQGRTVLVIAHRLSAVRNAHRIIVMDKGRIVEMGAHEQLVAKPKGLYAYLWQMQGGIERTAVAVENQA
ncbi:hypothetical protein SAMN02787076_06140 [Rhizobacter sp. OV335]|nr:hypothetical protein SAMN02787076_06140 [Rhizobacter sp. OV335]